MALSVLGLLLSTSQFAKAEQEQSQNLEVSVLVSRSCNVSTERATAGAQLDAGCPAYAKQSLVRELAVTGERGSGQSGVIEQLVLVINF